MGTLFQVNVDYKSPSQDSLFLERGWGIRDVRGAYLNGDEGTICVSPWALSRAIASVIRLRFEMSNRSLLQAVSLKAGGEFGARNCFLTRNKETELVIENVLLKEDAYLIRVIHPKVIHSGNFSPGLSDFIAINGLTLSR